MWDLIVSVPDHCLSFYFDLFLRLRSNYRLDIHPYVFFHISRNNISMDTIMYSILTSKVKNKCLFSNGIANYKGHCEQNILRTA